ncbi:MAG: hypothetical protein IJX64_04940 [Clostridia bacterium]|nr:hypothetical protein [Clostridia bacterium]
MKTWKRLLNSYFLSIGCVTFVWVIIKSLVPNIAHSDLIIGFLQGTILATIPTVLTSFFFLSKTERTTKKWVARLIYILIVSLSYSIAFLIVGVLHMAEPIEFIGYFAKYSITAILLAIPLFIIIDIIQKRNLKKINEKLKQNELDQ